MHVASVYGPVDPTTIVERADVFWHQVAQWAAVRNLQPVCIGGDYNLVHGENQYADSLLVQGQYTRTLDAFEQPRLPTHMAGRAIDHIFHSHSKNPTVEWACIARDWHFPSHRAVTAIFNMSLYHSASVIDDGVCLNTPRALLVSKALKEERTKMKWDHSQDLFQCAMRDRDVDSMLQHWTDRWEAATIQAAENLCVKTTTSMEGRSHGDIGRFGEQPISRTSCHLPLGGRQLRKTWSMMKSWLLS
eukprot:3396418-Amphidinium_carterae.1